MVRKSGREVKPTPKGLKYIQGVQAKKTKAKTLRNAKLQKGELQALPIPKGFRVEEEDDFDMGQLTSKLNTMKVGSRRKTRRHLRN